MSQSHGASPVSNQIAMPFKARLRIGSAISLRGLRDEVKRVNGINAKIAVFLTNIVGSMWCAYAFAVIAFIGLPAALRPGGEGIISWIAQTFLQLVLLSVIMVGQRVLAKASDKQSLQTFNDAEAILDLTDQIHHLIEVNNRLTDEIHTSIAKPPAPGASAQV